MAEGTYRPNSPPVIHETIEHETIVVNLVTGTYYQLAGVGADVWQAIESGVPPLEIGPLIAERYGVEAATAEADVAELVRQLQDEDLVVVDPDATPRPPRSPDSSAPPSAPYRAPQLAKFTDMQDLLLLDPVHEVDATGWPAAPV